MPELKSCGFLLVRGEPIEEFLLMRHADRWDLPKGHVDTGESEMECALRELREETGIEPADIEIVDGFRFAQRYPVQTKVGKHAEKTLVIYLARLVRDRPLALTEHIGSRWFPWNPPHRIQERSIDPVLAAVHAYLESSRGAHE
jgi:bis(5'-nucleosidyl)-tetraphosphatase